MEIDYYVVDILVFKYIRHLDITELISENAIGICKWTYTTLYSISGAITYIGLILDNRTVCCLI